ncbi:NADP-dependent oxidoreductase [Glycomyces sp. NPDC046736]|uniref:NADP-dependent oxidoreductase n=1 Tax=Glycomyces sp. NPDC046736 TaxID=3155615 RepID=UPI0033D7C91D
MKAMRFHTHGGSDVLAYEEVDRPQAGPGQVVVAVAGTALNMLDVVIRAGLVTELFPVDLPHIPGFDVSGTVAEIGEGVTDWRAGDAVIAMLPFTGLGSSAEYVAVPADHLAAAPTSIPLADAASLPVSGLTAWQALFENLELASGQRLLVNGGGGALGGLAIQLAVRAGAKVTATASPASREAVIEAGAEEIVDYTEKAVTEALAGQRFDAVLQLVRTTAEDTAALLDLIEDGGILAYATVPASREPERGIRTSRVEVRSDATQLAELAALVDAGELHLRITDRRPLADLAQVHDLAFSGGLHGKIILTP